MMAASPEKMFRADSDESLTASSACTSMRAAALRPSRVVLAVPDLAIHAYFEKALASRAPVELLPATSVDQAMTLVEQAARMPGGLLCVLAHPEFLRSDAVSAPATAGLVQRVHAAGHSVVAFGWAPKGYIHDRIEASGCDAWFEGPSFGADSKVKCRQWVTTLVRLQDKQQLQHRSKADGERVWGMRRRV